MSNWWIRKLQRCEARIRVGKVTVPIMSTSIMCSHMWNQWIRQVWWAEEVCRVSQLTVTIIQTSSQLYVQPTGPAGLKGWGRLQGGSDDSPHNNFYLGQSYVQLMDRACLMGQGKSKSVSGDCPHNDYFYLGHLYIKLTYQTQLIGWVRWLSQTLKLK